MFVPVMPADISNTNGKNKKGGKPMKKFIVILLCFVLVLSGCGKQRADTSSAPTSQATAAATVPDTEPAATEPAPETEPSLDPQKDDKQPGKVIETKYYTISLFDGWADACDAQIFEMHSGLEIVSLYEKTSQEAFGGGKLCSIQLMPVQDDTYKDFPSYELLGVLNTPDGSFHVIALYPTDVQYDDNTAQAYQTLFDNLHDVFCNLSPTEGTELVMSAPTP